MQGTLSKQTVGVVGSGSEEHEDHARAVGEVLADLGVNLLTGGGRGVMTAVSRAFTQRRRGRGICIGIIPCAGETDRATPKPGYPNEFVELAIYTHLPYSGPDGTHDLSRNHINILSCVAVIALPGELGTAAEVSLAIRYGRPVIAFARDPGLVRHFPPSVRRVASIDDVREFLRAHIDEYDFIAPGDVAEWRAYHDIRRSVLFEARGQFGVYDETRPDETAPGHHPRLLLHRGDPVGVIRIDIEGTTAILRRVAVRSDAQRLGHGRALLSFAQRFAQAEGCSRLLSHVAPDAVAFYRNCGFVGEHRAGDEPSADESVVMTKGLQR
jgi:uncharacterized protein (TIGR00725 family)